MDMTVLIPALDEGLNLAILLPWLNRILEELQLSYDVVVVTNEGDRETIETASRAGAGVLLQVSKGYGGALVDGLKQSSGDYILTLDADLSHRPDFVPRHVELAARRRHHNRFPLCPGRHGIDANDPPVSEPMLNLVFRRGLRCRSATCLAGSGSTGGAV